MKWITTSLPLLLALLVACGGGATEAGRSCGSSATQREVFHDLLASLPLDTDTPATVFYDNYACAREFLGISPPDRDANDLEVESYRLRLIDDAHVGIDAPFGGFSPLPYSSSDWRTEIGFDVANIDQLICVCHPPVQLVILRGNFDTERIDNAIRTETTRSSALEDKSYRGVSFYSWGRDNQTDLRNRTTVRFLGRGGRLAPSDRLLFWSYATKEIEGMIDASQGNVPSLAEFPGFDDLSEAVGKTGAFSFVLSVSTNSLSQPAIRQPLVNAYGEKRIGQLQSNGLLHPYVVLVAGVGQSDGELYSVLLYLNANEEVALANKTALESMLESGKRLKTNQLWRNVISKTETGVIGNVLYAKLWSTEPGLARDAFNNLESLILTQ